MPRATSPATTSVGVVGLGTMGAGIAETFARAGYHVVGVEQAEETLARGRQLVAGSTARALTRGKLTEDERTRLRDRITFTTDLQALEGCQVVVEAVVEQLPVKQAVMQRLDAVLAPEAILATNTSSLSVTRIAAATGRPGRVVGVHFFNPAPVQRLVEIVQTVVTEPAVVQEVVALMESLGKSPVVCGDRAGFIANALLFGYLNRAVAMYDGHHASREDIDAAMRLGRGYPMGPLALLDLIGLDTAHAILDTMYFQGRDRLHAPHPLLGQMVAAGHLGRKTGRGFYTYESPERAVVVPDRRTPDPGAAPRLRRDLRVVAVVGPGERAAAIAEVLTGADRAVRYVEDAADPPPAELRDADLVVSALEDDLEAQVALFRMLDRSCKPGAILATTAAVRVIDLAAVTGRPQDVLGMHFLDPVPVNAVVEVVSTVATEQEVAETARALCAELGKVAVACGDRAGFVVGGLLFPYLNDAVKMLEAGYASAADIDTAMRLGCALPTGPFETLDGIGADVALATERRLYQELREPGLAPAPLLDQMVTAGYLGRASGRGFRD